ncbi:MAG: carbon-phosphorus lyase, partial [Spirochaetaceae bacterium]
ALLQAEGSPGEAVFLIRAQRSTLIRKGYSHVVDTSRMAVERRISASFKDVPGGQIIGASPDYSHRLLDFSLIQEFVNKIKQGHCIEPGKPSDISQDIISDDTDLRNLPKVVDYLRSQGLMAEVEENEDPPRDITKEGLVLPANRSSRLQVLTRGQTGAVTALGYASLRGWGAGALHPTVGELRVGLVSVVLPNPYGSVDDEDDGYYLGEVRITEVESFVPVSRHVGQGKYEMEFEIGYGICFGQNETKAIAMSLLDHNLETGQGGYVTSDEEFILYHVDSVEATGFISHLKLPHYVTFQAKLDSVRKSRKTNSMSVED